MTFNGMKMKRRRRSSTQKICHQHALDCGPIVKAMKFDTNVRVQRTIE